MKVETVDDIIKEMKANAPIDGLDIEETVAHYAKRLEAARGREALDEIKNTANRALTTLSVGNCPLSSLWDIIRKCEAALAEPPRPCDVMSLKAAKKVWFVQEIIPRLNGDLPLGKEVSFAEWFVSESEQKAKGEVK